MLCERQRATVLAPAPNRLHGKCAAALGDCMCGTETVGWSTPPPKLSSVVSSNMRPPGANARRRFRQARFSFGQMFEHEPASDAIERAIGKWQPREIGRQELRPLTVQSAPCPPQHFRRNVDAGDRGIAIGVAKQMFDDLPAPLPTSRIRLRPVRSNRRRRNILSPSGACSENKLQAQSAAPFGPAYTRRTCSRYSR